MTRLMHGLGYESRLTSGDTLAVRQQSFVRSGHTYDVAIEMREPFRFQVPVARANPDADRLGEPIGQEGVELEAAEQDAEFGRVRCSLARARPVRFAQQFRAHAIGSGADREPVEVRELADEPSPA